MTKRQKTMEKVSLEDIHFYERSSFITIPANPRRDSVKERKRVDLSSLKKEQVLPGLIHFSGVVESVINRQISFWRLRKQRKLKSGETLRIYTHLGTEEDALKAYAEFKIKSKMYDK